MNSYTKSAVPAGQPALDLSPAFALLVQSQMRRGLSRAEAAGVLQDAVGSPANKSNLRHLWVAPKDATVRATWGSPSDPYTASWGGQPPQEIVLALDKALVEHRVLANTDLPAWRVAGAGPEI